MSNIVLQPNASGTGSITITTPNTNTDRTLNIPDVAGNLVTTGDSGTVSNSMMFSGFANGITFLETWRMTTTQSFTGGSTLVVDGSWETLDTGSYGKVGTGSMSVSSGVFTFPSTGIWHIQCQIYGRYTGGSGALAFFELYLMESLDGSNFTNRSIGIQGGQVTNDYFGLYINHTFDVTNTSTHKIRLTAVPQTGDNAQINGGTNASYTSLTFIKVGET